MKKFTQFIATMLTFGLLTGLSACDKSSGNPGGNVDPINPGSNVDPVNPGSNVDPVNPGAGNTSSSITDPGNPGGKKSSDPVALSDTVLYSHNRLKNADFSFNFSMSGSKKSSRSLRRNANSEGEEQDWTIDAEGNIDYLFHEGDTYDVEQFDYFKDKTQQLDGLRSTALSMVDFAVSNISVLDKRVALDGFIYCLSYDADNDIISLYRENDQNNGDCVIFIELYYNEEGLETVHFEQSSRVDSGEYFDLYYIPNYYYYFSQKGGGVGGNMQWLSVASKANGFWKGIQFIIDDENPIIKKTGMYDYGNRQVLPCFLIEQDGEFFTFTDTVVPTRNGRETWSNVEAQPGDGIELQRYAAEGEWGFFEKKAGVISIPMDKFSSLQSIHIDHNSIPNPANGNGYHPMLDENDNYILLKNGNKLKHGLAYNAKYGLAYGHPSEGKYVLLKDNSEVAYDEYESTCTAKFSSWDFHFFEGRPFQASFPIRFSCEWEKYDIGECFKTISEMFDALGLTFKKGINPDIMNKLAYLEKYSDAYRGQLFERILGEEYSAEAVFTLLTNLLEASSTRPDILRSTVAAIEKINYNDIPAVKDNAGAILPTLLSDQQTSLEFDATNKTIALTNPSVKVNKTIVLHNGEKYTVKIVKDGEVLPGDFYSTETYNSENITFSLLPDAPKLELPLEEGTHSYFARVYRIVDDVPQFPASKDLLLKVNEFEEFKNTVDNMETLGGNTEYTYSYNEGKIDLLVQFIDLTAPLIDFGVLDYKPDEEALHFNTFLTYKQFKEFVSVRDNYDKCLLSSDIAFYLDDEETPQEMVYDTRLSSFAEASVVHLVISDASGNKTDLPLKFVVDEIGEIEPFIVEARYNPNNSLDSWETTAALLEAVDEHLHIEIDQNFGLEYYRASDDSFVGFDLDSRCIGEDLYFLLNGGNEPIKVPFRIVVPNE